MRNKLWAVAIAAGMCTNISAVAAFAATDTPAPTTPIGPNTSAPAKKSVVDSTWIKSSERHSKFLVFTESGQAGDAIVQKSGHATIRAIAGTVMSMDSTPPMLHNGCIKVQCDKGTVTIGTRAFGVTIPDGATAIVESFPAIRSFRVVALQAPGPETVTVRYKQARLPVQLTAGQMVATEADHPTSPAKFDEAQFTLLVPEDKALLDGAATDSDPSRLLAIQGTQFKCMSSGALAIREGECLILTGSALTVVSPAAAALAKKNALVDVESYSGDFRVKSLSGPGHISLEEGGQSFPIHPGQELFVAKRVIEESDKTPPDGIGRRRFDNITMKDDTKAIMSDFSIMSFLNVEHAMLLRHSTDPVDHDMIERMLKTAAAVQNLTQVRGIYTAVPRQPRKLRKKESGPSA